MNTIVNSGADGGVVFAALMPHAPILVPAVAGDRLDECRASVAALRRGARRLVAARPDSVVLLSPHAPRAARAFGLTQETVAGSLAAFLAPQEAIVLPGDPALGTAIGAAVAQRGMDTAELESKKLDHGSVVPLWFLAEAGWRGPTVVLALAWDDNSRVGDLGESVAAAAQQLGRRVAVVASGDMSHCLKPGSPAGYNPAAARFDAAFIAQLRHGATRGIGPAVALLRECAAEDVVESTLFALGAAGWRADGREVLGYEGPFGVGYGVAVLFDSSAGATELPDLPALARAAIAAALAPGAGAPDAPKPGGYPSSSGVFVTLHGADDRLRGCIGTMVSHSGDLVLETWRMAQEAALRDGRFPAVQLAELDGLRIEVTVLDAPEAIDSPAELDPQRWGVVVQAADGRRGVLLPALPEVTSVAQQLAIARTKAGIGPQEPVRLQRFAARRIVEGARL